VRQRLLNRARADGEEFEYTLVRYANERLLYRLSKSPFRDTYVLKGAMLFAIWAETPHRPTRDVDLLGYDTIDLQRLEREFRDIATHEVELDGIKFKPGTVKAEQIRDGQAYEGVRITMKAELAGAAISVQVDIGFGDSTEPGLIEEELPTLLEFPPPRLRAYRPETVVAEKFEAMVKLGIANSRMKDFYDLYVMSRSMTFDRATLASAIRATFERRQTTLPVGVPTALADDFATDAAKLAQWRAFTNRSGGDASRLSLPDVIAGIREFLLPLVDVEHDASSGRSWEPASGWH
jgi:predicted nucleotidyltransferase component of viral defense system